MRVVVVDTYFVRKLAELCSTSTFREEYREVLSLWQYCKPRLESTLGRALCRIIVGARPRWMFLVFDPQYAEREIGPIAVEASGVTVENRDAVYLMPKTDISVATIIHEYVHWRMRHRLESLVPQIATWLYSRLRAVFPGDYTQEDVAMSLRANLTLLDEALTYRTEYELLPSRDSHDNYVMYASHLADAIVRDLGLVPPPGEAVKIVCDTVEEAFARLYKPTVLPAIDKAGLLANMYYVNDLLKTAVRCVRAVLVEEDWERAIRRATELTNLLFGQT